MTRSGPRTIGILADPYLNEWQVRALEQLRTDHDVTVSLVVTNEEKADGDPEAWNTRNRIGLTDARQFVDLLERQRAWALVLAERNLAKLIGEERPLWRRRSVENVAVLADADHVRCEPETDGAWYEFPDDVVDRVAEECDALVLFGFGLVRGPILEAPEFGVLSFHPADIRSYRGMGPPAVFHDGRDRCGATLQRLNESIDGGEIVAYDDVSIDDCATLWDVFDRVVSRQISLLSEGVANLRDPTFEPTTVPEAELGEVYYRKLRHSLSFSGRILLKNLAGRAERRLRRESGAVESPTGSSPPASSPGRPRSGD
ncbi:formyltransferase family protein [Natronococcus sp. A-GB1]|uniref:formyltransferase family protein n=1 Tax=Natronococcus sp. A-GB1 TaxID=3037648 RepID=UPI00241DBE92|nr:formyltransferase family protein [Natronococcus sp. A-GB1]MDG5760627.1 formyltransferase family protein [Natronococcus sp. A-GB1]